MATLIELEMIDKEMTKHERDGNMNARNELVPKYQEIYRKCDFGFLPGDLVSCPIESKRKTYTVNKITKDNRFLIANVDNPVDKLFVPGTVLEEYETEPEQLKLF